jgi:hypothetical protein
MISKIVLLNVLVTDAVKLMVAVLLQLAVSEPVAISTLVVISTRSSSLGFQNFANKTFANWTFANGESPQIYWRKYSGLSPIGESPKADSAALESL